MEEFNQLSRTFLYSSYISTAVACVFIFLFLVSTEVIHKRGEDLDISILLGILVSLVGTGIFAALLAAGTIACLFPVFIILYYFWRWKRYQKR